MGGNFQYYHSDVDVTAIDFSRVMIQRAMRAAEDYGIQATFYEGDTETIDLPDGAFDTVVSTLSMCAYDDPLRVLRQMNRWCSDDGRILLLEHGKSSVAPLSWVQGLIDPIQYRTNGCHANRDILEILSQSPLVIERHESHWLGAVHLIWARPNRC